MDSAVEVINDRNFSYNNSFYNSDDLAYFAQQAYEHLPEDVTVLVSGGSSGVALASAMLVIAGMNGRILKNMVFYTKESGVSHRGRNVEDQKCRGELYVGRDDHDVLCIVDDLIDTGSTVRSISTMIHEDARQVLKYILVSAEIQSLHTDFDKIKENLKIERIICTQIQKGF